MNTMSKTYIAAAATLIASFSFLNEAEALTFVNALVLVVTTIATFYGRYKAGGVNALGMKG